jgi:predicted NUDIX family NTP pyrophosphohydrolase
MKAISAGLLLYRRRERGFEVFLVHPGGPFWAKKDEGAWTIPKGLAAPGEDLLAAARREFREETGFALEGEFQILGEFRQPSGKIIHVWAVEGDCDPALLTSNVFPLEWPPKSGNIRQFPEIDRAAWLGPKQAKEKLLRGQLPILAAFENIVKPARARLRSSAVSGASARAGKRRRSSRSRPR